MLKHQRVSKYYKIIVGYRRALFWDFISFIDKLFRQIDSDSRRYSDPDFISKTLAQVFSRDFCKISKNTFLIEHLWWLILKALIWLSYFNPSRSFWCMVKWRMRCIKNTKVWRLSHLRIWPFNKLFFIIGCVTSKG